VTAGEHAFRVEEKVFSELPVPVSLAVVDGLKIASKSVGYEDSTVS